jgi:GrpB-like predicted nucleotidyltransferase (UPF0157 family)/catechol 2,3-dioxygenase-like lactoylglutathione lyase family enzyme
MIGLKHGQNLLVDYDVEWPVLFREEKAKLYVALGGVVRGIEHYGSTAVPGLAAKPILDILIGVEPLEDWIRCKPPLEELGYDYAEHAGVPNHFIFGRGRDRSERTHLIHIVEFNGESWLSNLAFRDALRADADFRQRYLAVKREAVSAAPRGRSRYNEIKQAFIEQAKDRVGSNWTNKEASVPEPLLFEAAFPFQNDVLALPVADLDAAVKWYTRAFGLVEVERVAQPHPTVILERDGVRIGFSINGGDAAQDGAAIRVSDIHRAKRELERNGVATANWRVEEQNGKKLQVFFVAAPDGLCYYFHQPI